MSELISFNQVAKKARLVNKRGIPFKDRKNCYERFKNIFIAIYNTDLEEHILSPSVVKDLLNKYCFSPSTQNTSFADYLVKKEILFVDYSIVNKNKFSSYVDIWKEFNNYCIYEKIDRTVIKDFENYLSEVSERIIEIDYYE